MNVKLMAATPQAEEHIVEVARVSSKREDKRGQPEGLLNYLIKHRHWSPFEHSYMTVEIETSKAIGIQLIRHRSFTFQEFSQRYQDVNLLNDIFEPIEFRKQAEDNRQSSTTRFDPDKEQIIDDMVRLHFGAASELYSALIASGVARETARFVLPLATKTKIHMTGSIRSWIHFFDLRDDGHAQKEIQEVARAIKAIFKEQFPIISKALGY